MQALSKPFVGQKVECRSARQSQRATVSLVVRASQEEQAVVRTCQAMAVAGAPSASKTCASRCHYSILRTLACSKIMRQFNQKADKLREGVCCGYRLAAACWVGSSEQLHCCPHPGTRQLPSEMQPE